MSDEEFHDFGSDDENAYDSDLYIEDDQPPAQPSAPRPAEPAPVRRYQPPPQPLNQDSDDDDYAAAAAGAAGPGRGGGGMRRFLNPAAFQPGFGGHAFARPPASAFRRQYRAYSTAILEVQQGRSYNGGRANLMYGGKIVMPPSALEELTQLDIESPYNFELVNPANPDLNTHVGVLEFIADEGCVNLPQWVMDQLRLNEGDPIRLVGGRYPKGKLVKIQPQSVDFLEISDPKAVLEAAMRNFAVVSAGDIIEVSHGQNLTFRLLIMEITPPGPAISVIDTDLEVDFAPPVGYVEPDYKAEAKKKLAGEGGSMGEKFGIDTKGKEEVAGVGGSGTNTPRGGGGGKGKEKENEGGDGKVDPWEAFKGSGNSLGGKRIKGKGVKAKAIEGVDEGSRIFRTDQPRIVTADTDLTPRLVPSSLSLPFGALFFGFDPSYTSRPPPGSAAEAALKQEEAEEKRRGAAPFAGVEGGGATLSGRQGRGGASAPGGGAAAQAPVVPAVQTPSQPSQPFGGQGNTLSAKKPVETIVID